MKKNALALSIATVFLLSANAVQAEEKHTISLGYAQSNVSGDMKFFTRSHDMKNILDSFDGKTNDLKGINLKYRYEFDQNLGIIGSLTSTYLENKANRNIAGLASRDIKTELSYVSLMVGPTWRFNEYVSVYGMAGIAKIEGKLKTSGTILGNSRSLNEKKKSNNFAAAAGIQFNPVPYIAIDLGYEYTKAKFGNIKDLDGGTKNYSGNIGTWTLGVGYRF